MLDHRVLELCNDREFVLVAVAENGIALKDASAALRNDARGGLNKNSAKHDV